MQLILEKQPPHEHFWCDFNFLENVRLFSRKQFGEDVQSHGTGSELMGNDVIPHHRGNACRRTATLAFPLKGVT